MAVANIREERAISGNLSRARECAQQRKKRKEERAKRAVEVNELERNRPLPPSRRVLSAIARRRATTDYRVSSRPIGRETGLGMILLRMNYRSNRYGNGRLRRRRGHGEPITLITRDVVIAATSHPVTSAARSRKIRRFSALYTPSFPHGNRREMTTAADFADRLSWRELCSPASDGRSLIPAAVVCLVTDVNRGSLAQSTRQLTFK